MAVSLLRPLPQRLWLSPSRALPARSADVADIGDESDALPPARRDAIWRAMRHFYRTGMNPGVTLAIRHRGELVFNRALGHRDVDAGTRLGVQDPVCLFSASKAVTAMLVHALVEEGRLKLRDRVCDYLPEYGCNGKEQTTLRDLLAHRAGVPRLHDASPELMFDRDAGLERLYAATPETRVGSRQAYHAITGGFILGEVLERVTGKSLNTLLDERFRQPLGMRYFHYGINGTDGDKVPRHYLTGMTPGLLNHYIEHAVGANLQQVVEVSNDPRFRAAVIPAGNLYATAEETTRFYQLLLDGGRWQGQQLLEPDTIRRATRPVSAPFVLDGSLLLPLRFSAGFMLGARLASLYGVGTPHAFGHLGFISITTWADPDRQLSVALLTTGKGVLGPQLPTMFRLFGEINKLGK